MSYTKLLDVAFSKLFPGPQLFFSTLDSKKNQAPLTISEVKKRLSQTYRTSLRSLPNTHSVGIVLYAAFCNINDFIDKDAVLHAMDSVVWFFRSSEENLKFE
jgi:hypothetical protein